MKKSNIIAIAGFKNSGKDTSAEMLRYLLNSPKFLHKYF
jgi:uridine kinase